MAAFAVACAGCGAHTPFKFNPADSDLAHYQDVATNIDAPNIANCPTDASISCQSPLTIKPDSSPEYWNLKLEEAMQMALMRNKVLHDLGGTVLRSPANARTIHGPAITETDPRYGVEAALAQFDAIFSEKFDYQRNNRLVNNDLVGDNTNQLLEDADTFQTQISKRAATGAEFNFRHNTFYDHSNTSVNKFRSSWDTNFEFEARQPLLQGAGVEYNRIAGPNGTPGNLSGVLLARVNTDISLAEFEIGVRDLVSNIENAYWDLYFAYRDLDSKIVARNSALESWQRTHALFEKGRQGGEAEREAEAREQYYLFEQEVENAWNGRLVGGTQTNNGSGGGTLRGVGGVRVAERRLRLLLGLPINDGKLLRPADEPSLAKVVFNWDQVLPEAITRRPELRRQRWVIKREELALIASKNFLLPRLDSYSLYRLRGFGHDLKDGPDNTPDNSAFRDLTSFDHQEWEFGMQLNMPLGVRLGHAAVRNTELLLARERAVLDDQEREVVHDLSNALADIDRAYSVAQTAYNRRMAARAQVAATRAAIESDRKVPLDLYLEAQRRQADSDSQFFAALADYALAVKNLHYEKGSLLDYNEIYLAEGPWPDKAYADASRIVPAHHQPKPLSYIMTQSPPPIGQDATATPVPPPHETGRFGHGGSIYTPDGTPHALPNAAPSGAPLPGNGPSITPPVAMPPSASSAKAPAAAPVNAPPAMAGANQQLPPPPAKMSPVPAPASSVRVATAPRLGDVVPQAPRAATPPPQAAPVANNSVRTTPPVASLPPQSTPSRFAIPDGNPAPAAPPAVSTPPQSTPVIPQPPTPSLNPTPAPRPADSSIEVLYRAAPSVTAPTAPPVTLAPPPKPTVDMPAPASANASNTLRFTMPAPTDPAGQEPAPKTPLTSVSPQAPPVRLATGRPAQAADTQTSSQTASTRDSSVPLPTMTGLPQVTDRSASNPSQAPSVAGVAAPSAGPAPASLPQRAASSSIERWQVPAETASATPGMEKPTDTAVTSIFDRPPQGRFQPANQAAPSSLTVRETPARRQWPEDSSVTGAAPAGFDSSASRPVQTSMYNSPVVRPAPVNRASFPASMSGVSQPWPTSPPEHGPLHFDPLPPTTVAEPLAPTTSYQPLPPISAQTLPALR